MIQVRPSDGLLHKLEADLFGPLCLEWSSWGTTMMDGYSEKRFVFSDAAGQLIDVWESRWVNGISYVAYMPDGRRIEFQL